ncbi:CAP domain-containing protein [Anaerococcus sp. NML200574]|uniref:CAP domain-containing protein n=1 Tax=Anaerococcus sp. NML200574 TaxID=2954486 RepID=UPI002236F22A|nr:CAP domain-containing protein [Anaerococcus sp. NML200574]MCW6678817.1 CAP domain-containing protein [Anaerococcus sp. NML200574]
MQTKKILGLALAASLISPLAISKASEIGTLDPALSDEAKQTSPDLISANEIDTTSTSLSAGQSLGITTNMPSAEKVKAYWRNYETRSTSKVKFAGINLTQPSYDLNARQIYSQIPNPRANQLGSLTDEVIEDTLHFINTYRFMVGLPEVFENKQMSTLAQSATLVFNLNSAMNHYPPTPAGYSGNEDIILAGKEGAKTSNLGTGYNSPYSAIMAYMDDGSPNNYKSVGHRRWLLNPYAVQMGIGHLGKFNATTVIDEANTRFRNKDVIAYPAANTLVELVKPSSPFSIQIGKLLDIDELNTSVKVENLKTGEVKTYTPANGLYISKQNYGYGSALIFGHELKKQTNASYRISVSGISDAGLAYPIEYTVNFIKASDPVNYENLDRLLEKAKTFKRKAEESSDFLANSIFGQINHLKEIRNNDNYDQDYVDARVKELETDLEAYNKRKNTKYANSVRALRQAFENNKRIVAYAENYMAHNYMPKARKDKLTKLISRQKVILAKIEKVIIKLEANL